MKNSLQYIDDYFSGQLKDSDRIQFEKKCESDVDFAREVSLYISMRGALKQSSRDAKKKDFESFHKQQTISGPIRRSIPIFAYISGIAASVLIFMSIYTLYFNKTDAKQLATAYISENLETLSVTMGTEQDSLAMGITAYNDKDYRTAGRIFEDLSRHPSVEFECVKYLGLISLTTDSYDCALQYFDRLLTFENRYANPGHFYKAITLMKRSEGKDETDAREILRLVVKDKMAGHKEAERWLKSMD